MAWNVTYRGKDGRQETIQIEATTRQGVFDELAKRGISAIRVEEAKGKLKKMPGNSKSGGIVKGLVGGVIIMAAVVAAIVYFIGSNEDADDDADRNRGKIAAVGQILIADCEEIVDAHGHLGMDNGDADVLS